MSATNGIRILRAPKHLAPRRVFCYREVTMLLFKKETISSLATFSFMKLFELKSNFCDSSLIDALHVKLLESMD